MTLSEIAKKIGVCKATVSLILNGKAKQYHISDETIRTVQEYCRKINYQPNIHAIRMGRKIVGNIMLLLNIEKDSVHKNNFDDYNIAQITGGIAQEIQKFDCTLSMRLFEPEMDGNKIFNCFRNHEIDGMIYYGLTIPDSWIKVFQNEQFKVVGIGIRPQMGISTVNINNREISRTLTKQLLEQGCHSFLYFAGTKSSYPGPERYAGFCEALAEYNIAWDENRRLDAFFDENTAFGLMDQYCIEKKPLPDAVICANDSMALGVMHALQKHGISIPETVKVAGGDNIQLSGYVSPGLTTFENLANQLGIEAVDLLQQQISSGYGIQNILLESRLIKRSSA